MRTRWFVATLLIVALALSGHIVAQTVVSEDDASTSTVRELLELTRSTTGTPAAGIGAEITFDLEDAGDVEQQAGIAVVLDDVTNGAEDATMTFTVNVAGTLTEVMRIDGSDGYVGVGTTTPTTHLELYQSAASVDMVLDGNSSGPDAELILDGEEDAEVEFWEDATQRGEFRYDSSNTRFALRAYNGGVADRIRCEDGTDEIEGDGTFNNSAFGPSEWVIGSAAPGSVVCVTGARTDDDGEIRATVAPCQHVACSKVVGVTVPGDQGVQYGRPVLEYIDTFESRSAWDGVWRTTHVGLELTGFRRVPVLGPVAVGDLLVSAGRDGRAMAMAEPGPGTIIGKAAQASDGPEGSIWVRVHLQSGVQGGDRIRALETMNGELRARVDALKSRLGRLRAQFPTPQFPTQDSTGAAR